MMINGRYVVGKGKRFTASLSFLRTKWWATDWLIFKVISLKVISQAIWSNIIYVPITWRFQPRQHKFSTQLQKAGAAFGSVSVLSYSMTNAILEVTKNFSIASFKPHLNYHECYLSLPVSQKLSLPLKMYIDQLIQHTSQNISQGKAISLCY